MTTATEQSYTSRYEQVLFFRTAAERALQGSDECRFSDPERSATLLRQAHRLDQSAEECLFALRQGRR